MSEKIKPEEIEIHPDKVEKEGLAKTTSRRAFLRSLGKWSAAIVGAVAGGALISPPDAAGWVNRGGGSWINRRGGWINGGGSWINRSGGGGSWINRRGF